MEESVNWILWKLGSTRPERITFGSSKKQTCHEHSSKFTRAPWFLNPEFSVFESKLPYQLENSRGKRLAYIDVENIKGLDPQQFVDQSINVMGKLEPIEEGSDDLVIRARVIAQPTNQTSFSSFMNLIDGNQIAAQGIGRIACPDIFA